MARVPTSPVAATVTLRKVAGCRVLTVPASLRETLGWEDGDRILLQTTKTKNLFAQRAARGRYRRRTEK